MNIRKQLVNKAIVIIFFLSIFSCSLLDISATTNSLNITTQNAKRARTANKKSKKNFYHYKNHDYGFAINIPSQLKLERNVPEVADHGPHIPLTKDSYIDFAASINSLGWENLDDGVKFTLKVLQENGKITSSNILKQEKYFLGKMPTIRLIIEYTTDQSSEPMIKDKVIAMRKSKNKNIDEDGINYSGINYDLCLCTKKSNYSEDVKIFEQILRSWREIAALED
ncbi:MAG: hypothetical protein HY819_01010 [Acidobacteria bacterium]|nr:hypothetical protein [Acidobacteriota bacterium]